MITRITFRVFLSCLAVCVVLILTAIWFGEDTFAEAYFKTTATFFIVGLASFLIWFSSTLLAIRAARSDES
jgi:hypothetical protein